MRPFSTLSVAAWAAAAGIARASTASAAASAGRLTSLIEHAMMKRVSPVLGPAHRLVAARARGGGDQHADRLIGLVRDGACGFGVEPRERSLGQGAGLAVDLERRIRCQGQEDLLLVARGLVVLRDALGGLDVDHVEAERFQVERAPNEQP